MSTYAPDRVRVAELALAGLLHDVGKLWRRVAPHPPDRDEELRLLARPVTGKGRFAHRHALDTAAFFERHRGLLPVLRETGVDGAASLAAHHHNPRTPLQRLIAEADALAIGRDERGRDLDAEVSARPRTVRLFSEMEHLELGAGGSPGALYRHEPMPRHLALEALLPQPVDALAPPEGSDLSAAIRALQEGFVADLGRLPRDSVVEWLAAAVPLWELYTAKLPAAAADERPLESLGAHGRTTAAVAAALYAELTGAQARSADALREERILDRTAPRFLLCSLHLEGAAEHVLLGRDEAEMSARAAETAALVSAAAERVLEDCAMPPCNLLELAGTSARLLLPRSAEPVLRATLAGLQRAHLERLGPRPFMVCGALALRGQDLMGDAFGQRWRRLADAARDAARRPLQELLSREPALLFSPAAAPPPPELPLPAAAPIAGAAIARIAIDDAARIAGAPGAQGLGAVITASQQLRLFVAGAAEWLELPGAVAVERDGWLIAGPAYEVAAGLLRLRTAFWRLACGNPELGLSAGLVHVDAAGDAALAGALVEQALGLARQQGRGGVCLLGSATVGWAELERCHDLARRLCDLGVSARRLDDLVQCGQLKLRRDWARAGGEPVRAVLLEQELDAVFARLGGLGELREALREEAFGPPVQGATALLDIMEIPVLWARSRKASEAPRESEHERHAAAAEQ